MNEGANPHIRPSGKFPDKHRQNALFQKLPSSSKSKIPEKKSITIFLPLTEEMVSNTRENKFSGMMEKAIQEVIATYLLLYQKDGEKDVCLEKASLPSIPISFMSAQSAKNFLKYSQMLPPSHHYIFIDPGNRKLAGKGVESSIISNLTKIFSQHSISIGDESAINEKDLVLAGALLEKNLLSKGFSEEQISAFTRSPKIKSDYFASIVKTLANSQAQLAELTYIVEHFEGNGIVGGSLFLNGDKTHDPISTKEFVDQVSSVISKNYTVIGLEFLARTLREILSS